MRRTSRYLIAAFAFVLLACSDDKESTGQFNQPGQSGDWSEVSRRVRCGTEECFSGKLVVLNSGEFFVVNTTIRGRLTSGEFKDVQERAEALRPTLDIQDIQVSCAGAAVPGLGVATEIVTLRSEQRGEDVVYEFNENDGQTCILGDKGAVEALRGSLETVMKKYAPVGRPGEAYDPCAGKKCGDRCTLCSPSDLNCVETAVLKFCTRTGECRASEPVC